MKWIRLLIKHGQFLIEMIEIFLCDIDLLLNLFGLSNSLIVNLLKLFELIFQLTIFLFNRKTNRFQWSFAFFVSSQSLFENIFIVNLFELQSKNLSYFVKVEFENLFTIDCCDDESIVFFFDRNLFRIQLSVVVFLFSFWCN